MLTMRVEAPPGTTVLELPEFDWEPPFMLLDVGEVVVENQSDGSRFYTQLLDMRIWAPGDHQTPDTFVRYQIGDEVYSVPVRPVFFTVPTVLESDDLNELEPRPLKPQIGFFYVPPWLLVVGVVLVGLAVWFGRERYLAWLVTRRERNRVILTPGQVMRGQLVSLQSGKYEPGAVYLEVADALRDYLYALHDVLALDLTTTEVLDRLQQVAVLDDVRQEELQRMLEQSDLVKFADYRPSAKSAAGMVNFALTWLEQIEAAQQTTQEQDILAESA